MGRLIQSFNPFDPSDPMYETSANPVESQAMGVPSDTQYAGTNFYEDRDAQVHGVLGGGKETPISEEETEFDDILS